MKLKLSGFDGISEVKSANELLRRLRAQSPAGFAIALHVQFTTPRYLFQSYDKDWQDYYSANSLVMQDPTVRWGFANVGWVRWRDLAADDSAGVLTRAADYGARHGATFALTDGGSRSMASFARPDREISDIEIARIGADFRALHMATMGAEIMTPELHEMLRQMSIFLTHG